ncbi:MAG: FAD-dependent oxidoreductase, partial [Herbiconiux sp.]|nr:FAD-dependent oxidoreductase [Herbiconiux sp.]
MQRIETEVCIVGGGPAGMMLGYLLARAGADVTVLEKHADFLRDFRGDTIHPSTLGLLGELGLREEFLALPHSEVRSLDAVVSGIRLHAVDFARLGPPDDVLVFMPQWDFLDFVARKAAAFPNFHLRVATPATGLLRDSGSGSSGGSGEADAAPVTGVAATGPDGDLEIVAGLTVAADGRSSTVRAAAGLEPRAFGVAVDVLWFALPRPQREPRSTLAYLDRQSFVVTIDRRDHFQAGVVIPKGRFAAVRERGLEAFRRDFAATAKPFAGVIGAITDWQQVKLLDVQIARLDTWHRPGLLCIGDAAHAMSPIGGVGINLAVQ